MNHPKMLVIDENEETVVVPFLKASCLVIRKKLERGIQRKTLEEDDFIIGYYDTDTAYILGDLIERSSYSYRTLKAQGESEDYICLQCGGLPTPARIYENRHKLSLKCSECGNKYPYYPQRGFHYIPSNIRKLDGIYPETGEPRTINVESMEEIAERYYHEKHKLALTVVSHG